MVDIRIMACQRRSKNVECLLSQLHLSEDAVTWDDRPNGGDAMYTARKAWLHPLPVDATHRVVLQDDVTVCDGFTAIVTAIAQAHPDCAVSGINFLRPFDYRRYATPYHKAVAMSGCMIMLPTRIIIPCMDWCNALTDSEVKPHDDLCISMYCETHSITMLTTYPNIVQHPDDDTLLPYKYNWVRTSHFFDPHAQADWGNEEIIGIT